MRCPKCGLHSAIQTSVLTSSPPILVYKCAVDDCKHRWQEKTQYASKEVDPNHLSLEERVELLERLVFDIYSRETRANLPNHPNTQLIERIINEQWARECIDKAKGGEG